MKTNETKNVQFQINPLANIFLFIFINQFHASNNNRSIYTILRRPKWDIKSVCLSSVATWN